MKYPKEQFELLVKTIEALAGAFGKETVSTINESALHFQCYQQHGEGQDHNRIVKTTDGLKRKHRLNEGEEWEHIITPNSNFELYPKGCNDSHIITAVKAALKEINSLS